MTKDLETLYATVLIFGLLSAVVYLFVLRPLFPSGATPATGGQQPHRQRQQPQQQIQNRRSDDVGRNSRSVSDGKVTGSRCARVPSHVSPSSALLAVNGGSNLLVDGIVAFRHGTAAAQESLLNDEQQTNNRKERARVLSRLLDDRTSSPPAKGSTVVLAIPQQDVDCVKLHKVVHLLATYYNLLLLVAVDSEFNPKEKGKLLERLREREGVEGVSTSVLPDHRIVLASTVAGRVAFARQLQRIDLVLDFDPEVRTLLSRFGHRVVVYGEGASRSAGSSLLGGAVLS